MATSTTRLGLTKPAGSDVVDVAVLNANSDKIDAAVGIVVCTSTTRPTSPYIGQQVYETDTKQLQTYTSSGWQPTVNTTAFSTIAQAAISPLSSTAVATQAARDALFPSPAQGNAVWRVDKGWEERYFAAYNSSTNPGGATPAGWYPVSGNMPKASVVKSGNTSLTGAAWNILNGAGVFSQSITSVGMDSFYATSSDGCFKAPITGVYRVSLMIHTDTVTSTGPQAWAVDKNNTAAAASYPDTALLFSAANTGNTSWTTATGGHNLVKLSANDKLRIHVYNYGATIQFTGDTYSIFSIEWVGPAQ